MAFLLKSNVIFGSLESDEFAFASLLRVVEVKAIESPSATDAA
jgi:hypothetical protein